MSKKMQEYAGGSYNSCPGRMLSYQTIEDWNFELSKSEVGAFSLRKV